MPAFFTNFVDIIKGFWGRMSMIQRVAVAGGAVALLSAVIGLSVWLSRPEYRVLYSNLGAEDASHVIKALQTDKIPYQLADNGATIMVPREVVYDQRIKIAGEGGLVGQGVMIALRFGVARGLFSNESGMGSAPLVASAAQTRNPVRQALVSATGTFWDTVVVCLMTGLVLVSTIMKNPEINMDTIADGGQLTTAAFSQIPVLGPIILVVGIITFAWSTILGWSYYGERCAQYLWGKKALLPYKLLFVAVVVVGPVLALDLVWTIADILNALMAIPNLIAVLLLSGVTARETNYYLNHLEETDRTEIPLVDR